MKNTGNFPSLSFDFCKQANKRIRAISLKKEKNLGSTRLQECFEPEGGKNIFKLIYKKRL